MLLVSFLSLGLRTGMVVALSVPLVLGIVFLVMSLMGMDLNRITLGALIIALGLLVDDAIIAVEMMVVKLEEGWDRLRAAAYAYTSTAFPMLTGTLVTAAGFMPVGFAKSIAGQYAGGIFWVVGVALILSWVVAVVFTPYLGVLLLPKTLSKNPAAGVSFAFSGGLSGALPGPLSGALPFSVGPSLSFSGGGSLPQFSGTDRRSPGAASLTNLFCFRETKYVVPPGEVKAASMRSQRGSPSVFASIDCG